jgi:hypothetical protein
MIQKAEDIEELLKGRHRENRTTEYKSKLSSDSDSLMKAVSSLANSIGGELLFGIEAKDGVPTAAPGLVRSTIDKEMLRLMQLARSSLEPPIALREIDFQEISWKAERAILVLRIAQSWARPHQLKNTGLFYGRSPAGAYFLHVSELRELFEMSESLLERANNFFEVQLKKVLGGTRPVRMATSVGGPGIGGPYAAPKIAFHVIPISAFSVASRVDIRVNDPRLQRLLPLGAYRADMMSYETSSRLNLEGWVNSLVGRRTQTNSYLQIYRNGILEAVHAPDEEIGQRNVVHTNYEAYLSKALPDYVSILGELEIEPPFLLYLSLLNVNGWYLRGHEFRTSQFAFDQLDQNVVRVPELMVSEPGFDTDRALLDLFNVVWQAVGEERSPRDRNGRIVPL